MAGRNRAPTTYLFDVRTPEEYEAGHLPGSRSTPGGQLVQETDHVASVRGARLVLVDDDGVRANMSASWLAQMGWQVAVLDGLTAADFSEQGAWSAPLPPKPQAETISPQTLADWLREPGNRVLDFTASANYAKRHIPGAAWVPAQPAEAGSGTATGQCRALCAHLRQQPAGALRRGGSPRTERQAGVPARWRHRCLGRRRPAHRGRRKPSGGVAAHRPLPPPVRRHRHPREAMQGYLDWEFGLVEQLGRDGTHGFRVLQLQPQAVTV